jgi:hypothetical protein
VRIGTEGGRNVQRQTAQKGGDVYVLELRKLPKGCFFFAETKRNISTKYANLYGSSGFDERKAGIEKLNDSFGWYLTLKSIAESGIFNQPTLTPLQSAEQADLYEAFTYLAACKAEADYQKRLSEVHSKKS